MVWFFLLSKPFNPSEIELHISGVVDTVKLFQSNTVLITEVFFEPEKLCVVLFTGLSSVKGWFGRFYNHYEYKKK